MKGTLKLRNFDFTKIKSLRIENSYLYRFFLIMSIFSKQLIYLYNQLTTRIAIYLYIYLVGFHLNCMYRECIGYI